MGANQKRRYLKIALPTGTASKLWNERQLCLLPVQDTGQAIEIKDLIYWNYVFFWHGNPVFKWPNNSVSLVNVMLKGILKDPSPANNLPRCSARPVSREEGEPRIKKWRIDIIYIYIDIDVSVHLSLGNYAKKLYLGCSFLNEEMLTHKIQLLPLAKHFRKPQAWLRLQRLTTCLVAEVADTVDNKNRSTKPVCLWNRRDLTW